MEYLIYAIIAWIIWKLFFSKKIFKKRLGYEGELKDNKRQGKGMHIWPNGDKYEGEWNEGKKEGKGKFTSLYSETVDENVIKTLVGHEKEFTMKHYGGEPFSPERLLEEISKVSYSGINWKKLQLF